jgi:hypothetical protein
LPVGFKKELDSLVGIVHEVAVQVQEEKKVKIAYSGRHEHPHGIASEISKVAPGNRGGFFALNVIANSSWKMILPRFQRLLMATILFAAGIETC